MGHGRKPRVRTADTSHLEKEEEHTIKSFFLQQLNKFFVQHLPMESLKEFPPSYMYYVGTISYMAMIGTFVYFTYQSYIGSIEQAFIALDPSSGDCSSVPIAITQTYLGDSNGNWVGTPQFTYSLAPYSLSLNNFKVDSFEQYELMMQTFYQSLATMAADSRNHSLAYNLMLWGSWIQYYSTDTPNSLNFSSQGLGQLQYFQMTGQPSVIFNAQRQQAVISSGLGICSATGYTSYDSADARITTSLNYTSYSLDPLCEIALNPKLFGYTAEVDNHYFVYGLDVNSFATAMSVNYGILTLNDLGIASPNLYHFSFNEVEYSGRQYFDLRYPYMTPILCIQNVSRVPEGMSDLALQLCFVVESLAVSLPAYHHFGLSFRYPIPCYCGEEYDNAGSTRPCQVFNMLASLIFFEPTLTPEDGNIELVIMEQVMSLIEISIQYPTYSAFMHETYNGSWSAAATAYGHKAPQTETPAWQEESFAFCTNSKGQKCSMATFNSYNAINRIVSQYKYQLMNASCTNSFTIHTPQWDKLVSVAPVQLTQDYYDCLPTASSAFMNALGIATGNTQLIVPFAVLATIPLVYLFLVLIQRVPPKEEYSPAEKDEVMEIVSIILLRLRDGKSRGIKKNGVLMRLTKELIKAAKEEVGFPDSDDDDEDDEEGDEDDASHNTYEDDDEDEGMGDDDDSDDDGLDKSEQPYTAYATNTAVIDSDDEVEAVVPVPIKSVPVTNNTKKKRLIKMTSSSSISPPSNKRSKRKIKRASQRTSIPQDYDTWDHSKGDGIRLKKASKMAVFTRQLDDEAGHNTGEGYYPGKYLIHAVRNVREQVVRRRSSHMDAATQEAAHSSRSPGYPGDSHRSARKGHKGRHPAVSEDGAELTAFRSPPPPNAHGLDQSNLDTTYELSRPSVSRSRSQTNMHKRLVFRIIAQEGIPSGCIILNALDRAQVQNISKKNIKDLRTLSQLVEDISKQAMQAFSDADSQRQQHQLNPMQSSVAGADTVDDLQRQDSSLFQLTSRTMRLLFVDFEFLLALTHPHSIFDREETTMMLLQLVNAMRLHGAVLLQVSLKEMEDLLSTKVGYNVGGRFVSANHVTQMMSSLSEHV